MDDDELLGLLSLCYCALLAASDIGESVTALINCYNMAEKR